MNHGNTVYSIGILPDLLELLGITHFDAKSLIVGVRSASLKFGIMR